ncbi:MAG TPA: putative Ig domain-containing protein, partial [Caldilineaceae bacterium]|nr:putative Ig domain-containing protein [Caldilineaceae bacterium]
MNRKSLVRPILFTLVIVAILALIYNPLVTYAGPLSAHQALTNAWQQATQIGQYRYRTDLLQTVHPTAKLANVGRQLQIQTMRIAGEMDRPGASMTLQITNGNPGSQRTLDLRVVDGVAFGRANPEAEWRELDTEEATAADVFAPGGDPLGFVTAAKEVQLIATSTQDPLYDKLLTDSDATEITRYAFAIDGLTFARYMRNQLEDQLRSRGELPAGLHVEMAREYIDMVGSGELWLNADGLPVRQIIHLEFPPQADATEWLEAKITTAFSDWDQGGRTVGERVTQLWQEPLSLLHGPTALITFSSTTAGTTGLLLLFCLAAVGFTVLCITHRRSRRFYVGLAVSVIVAMIIGPLLQTQQVSAFFDRQAAQRTVDSGTVDSEAVDSGTVGSEAVNSRMVDSGQLVTQHAGAHWARNTNYATRITHYALQSTCTVDNEADSDCDGLSDATEINKLGTNPDNLDSDGDLISDRAEVVGYAGTSGGSSGPWYLDPLNADSNGDGLSDGQECLDLVDVDSATDSLTTPAGSTCPDTDGDGVADVFDHDNDGDGVPDRQDSDPNYIGDLTTVAQSEFDFALDGYDTATARPVVATFEVRPTRYEDLYQTNNVVDWPDDDTTGQVTRVNDNTFSDLGYSGGDMAQGDMLLVPTLELHIPAPADNPTNPSGGLPVLGTFSGAIATAALDEWLDTDALDAYGITVNQDASTGDLYAYLPLTVIEDQNGGAPVAWGAQMLYRPESSTFGDVQTVKLVWQVQALNDYCDTSAMGSDDDFDAWCAADSGHWVTAVAVIQAYYEEFYLTGMTVQEAHGFGMAVLGQKDALTQPYAADLWHLGNSLMSAFVGGKLLDTNNDNVGDRRFDVAEIVNRFSAGSGVVWDVDTSNLVVASGTYSDTSTGMDALIGATVPNLLATTYPAATADDDVTLLIAREEAFRTVSLGQLESGDVQDTGDTLTVNASLAGQSVQTYATLHWTPYSYDGVGWSGADIADQLDTLESNLEASVTDNDIVEMLSWFNETPTNPTAARIGAIAMARNYYLALYTGSSGLVEDESVGFVNDATLAASLVNDADYSRDFNGDNVIDETWLIYIAVTAGMMQSYFEREGEPLLDEVNEVLEVVAFLAVEADEDPVGAVGSALEAGGKAARSAIKKAIKIFYTVDGAAKYYKGRSYVSKITTALGLTTFALGAYAFLSGTQSRTLNKVMNAVDLASALVSAYDAVRIAISIGNSFAQTATNSVAVFKTVYKLQNSNRLSAAVGFVITVGIATALFVLSTKDIKPGTAAYNAQVALFTAQIILAVITAVIAATIVGAIVLAIIGLIDTLISLICQYNGKRESDNVKTWVCGGLNGIASQILLYLLYDYALVADLEGKDRLQFAFSTPLFSRGASSSQDGVVVGNAVTLGALITNTLKMGKPQGIGSGVADVIGEFFTSDNLKRSAFSYTLQPTQTTHYDDIVLGEQFNEWQKQQKLFQTEHTFTFDQVGLNQPPGDIYLTESFKIPAMECWGFGAQYCRQRVFRNAVHYDFTGEFLFDVFPATFDEFITVVLDENRSGYRMAWSGDDFPVLWDADGDGLVSQAQGGPDPNDQLPDSDFDGLSDRWEYENGMDLLNADGDGDGLGDYWELVYQTNPHLADSDGDGLLDGEEFFHPDALYPYKQSTHTSANLAWSGGWEIVYDRDGSGDPRITRVSADPLAVDGDADFISDSRERIYGYNPAVKETVNILSLDAQLGDDVVAPSAALPYTATIKNELDNRVLNGLLQAEFPVDTVQTTAVIETLSSQETVTMTGAVNAPAVSASTATSLTLRAGAVIEDEGTGRVLWLHFNEAGGSTFADSAQTAGGPHNATCSGAACPTPKEGYATFDGNDTLTVAHHDEFDLTAFTVNLWIQPSSTGQKGLVSKGNTGIQLRINDQSALAATMYLADCTTAVSTSGGSLSQSKVWYLATATYDGDFLRLYLNGDEVGAVAAGSTCSNSSAWTLGSSFAGAVDEIQLYPKALSAIEIAEFVRQPVLYLSNVSGAADGTYRSLDESAFGQAVVFCSDSSTQDFGCADEVSSGAAGAAISFNGTNGLDVNGPLLDDSAFQSLLHLGDNNNHFTISTWMRPNATQTPNSDHRDTFGQMVLGYDSGSYVFANGSLTYVPAGFNKAYPSLYIKGQKVMIRFGHADGLGYCEAVSANSVLVDDQWQHVTVAFNGSVFALYINGALAETFTGTDCAGQALYPRGSFQIGYGSGNAIRFRSLSDISGTNAAEGFIWALLDDNNVSTNTYDNGYDYNSSDQIQLIWNSAENIIVKNTTVDMDGWMLNEAGGRSIDFAYCDRDKPKNGVPEGCLNGNAVFSVANPGSVPASCNSNLGICHDYDAPGSKSVGFTFSGKYDLTVNYDLYTTGFQGQLDEIRLYREALTAEEAATLYESSIRSVELRFDEPPGQAIFADATSNDFDAVCSGTLCPDSGIPGRGNQAVRFDGVDDRLTVGNAQSVGITGNNFTVLAWVKADDLTGERAILGTDDNGNLASLMLSLSNGAPQIAFGGTNSTTTSPTALTTDTWYHVAFRYDADAQQQSIFVNGENVSTSAANRQAFVGAAALRVGSARGGNYFDGLIDHLVIVKKALDVNEIQRIMREVPLFNLHLDEDQYLTLQNYAPGLVGLSYEGTDNGIATCQSNGKCPALGSKGQMREAAIFTDGGSNYQSLSLADAAFTLGEYTLGLWVKPRHNQPTMQHLVGKRGPFGDDQVNYSLLLNPDNTVRFTMDATDCSTAQTLDSTAIVTQDQWNHIMATFDGATMRIYINGVLDANSRAATTPCQYTDQVVYVGGVSNNNNWSPLDAELDEVTLHGVALTDSEVRAIYDYQNAWYDVTSEFLVQIDAEAPTVSLDVNAVLPLADHLISISAIDASSYVRTVTATIRDPNGAVTTPTATADGEAWLVPFTPTVAGAYRFTVEATDAVGNKGAITDQVVTVDDTAPTLSFTESTAGDNLLSLSGAVTDDMSGVAVDSLRVTLLDAQGVAVNGVQLATVVGGKWSIDYALTVAPYGQYRALITVEDGAGNRAELLQPLSLDRYGPVADVTSPVGLNAESGPILSGTASDLPYPLTNRLLHLHFEEAVGATSFADSSPAKIDVTCITLTCPTAGATGRHGAALRFDGQDDTLELASPIDPAQDEFTLALWFKVQTVGPLQSLVRRQFGTPSNLYWLYVDGSGNVGTAFDGSLVDSTPIAADTWTHAAVTFDGTTLALYVNGELRAQKTDATPATYSGNLLLGGGTTDFGGYLNGMLDEVLIYESALPAKAIYDMAHPLDGEVAALQLRLRTLEDGDLGTHLGADAGDWLPIPLTDLGDGFAAWQYDLGTDVENFYQADLKATDSLGNSRYIPNAWSGAIDTIAPRLSLNYAIDEDDNSNAFFTCSAEDFNLTATGWSCPLVITPTAGYQDAAWFTSIFTDAQKLATLSASGSAAPPDTPAVMACDLVGNCATYSVAGNTAPVLDPIAPQNVTRGETLTITITAGDADGDALSFSLGDAPDGATIDPATGVFIWTPDATLDTGLYTATVIVSDGLLTDSQSISITVLSETSELEVAMQLGIVGITPPCATETRLQVPRNTAVIYCYTVHNQTLLTHTINILTDSHWGTLLDHAFLTLAPDAVHTHMTNSRLTDPEIL